MITNLIKKTAAEWNTENPVLAEGHIGFDITNNSFRIGNGQSKWMDLGLNITSTDTSENFNSMTGIVLQGDKIFTKYTQSGAFTITIKDGGILGCGAILPVLIDGSTITVTGATKDPKSDDASSTSGDTDRYVFWKDGSGVYYSITNLGQ